MQLQKNQTKIDLNQVFHSLNFLHTFTILIQHSYTAKESIHIN